jgi:D-sorbitol dehydrogenase (acceptor)
MADRLEGKRALITGAAQGIGQAIAEEFIAEGAVVETLDRQEGLCDHTLDLANTDSISSFVSSLSVCPDILVNSAGVCLTKTFFDIDLESFEQTFRVNVFGLFALSQAIASRMKAEGKGGAIINIASNSAFGPKLEQLDYGASKAAVVSITKSSALSLGPLGIRVNAIAPGIIDTPLTQSIALQRAKIRGVSPKETLAPVLSALPLTRMGTTVEVAALAVFLASDEASYITGQTYLVDGGQVMR